jgi:hypothetical protein
MKKLILATFIAAGLLAIPVSTTTWTSGVVGASPAAAKCTNPPTTRDEQVVRNCDKGGW